MGDITGDYVWHMEEVLYQYHLLYDVRYPLICFDERPCFLIEYVGGILPLSPGKRNAIIMNTRRTGRVVSSWCLSPIPAVAMSRSESAAPRGDYAQFMQTLLTQHYPEAKSIRLVQDNLNTHTPGSFYQSCRLRKPLPWRRSLSCISAKKGSWLNMAGD